MQRTSILFRSYYNQIKVSGFTFSCNSKLDILERVAFSYVGVKKVIVLVVAAQSNNFYFLTKTIALFV